MSNRRRAIDVVGLSYQLDWCYRISMLQRSYLENAHLVLQMTTWCAESDPKASIPERRIRSKTCPIRMKQRMVGVRTQGNVRVIEVLEYLLCAALYAPMALGWRACSPSRGGIPCGLTLVQYKQLQPYSTPEAALLIRWEAAEGDGRARQSRELDAIARFDDECCTG
jgi:hypothetical protein